MYKIVRELRNEKYIQGDAPFVVLSRFYFCCCWIFNGWANERSSSLHRITRFYTHINNVSISRRSVFISSMGWPWIKPSPRHHHDHHRCRRRRRHRKTFFIELHNRLKWEKPIELHLLHFFSFCRSGHITTH